MHFHELQTGDWSLKAGDWRRTRQLLATGGCLAQLACGMEHKEPAPLVGEITEAKAGEALKGAGYNPADVNPAAAKDSTAYIEKTFQALIGELPAMGWLVAPAKVIAGGNRPEVFVFGPAPGFVRVSAPTVLTSAARDSARRERRVACDAEPGDMFSAYQWPAAIEESEAVMLVHRAFREPVESGMRSPPLTTSQLAEGRKFADTGAPLRWKDSTFAAELSGAVFSVHASFDSDGDLVRSALVLRTDRGVLVGRRVLDFADYAACDGCEAPTFSEGFDRVYRILNVFAIPGFAFPVLLVDTSTSEGRARSFMTFTPGGAFSEFRLYEYVVNCASK